MFKEKAPVSPLIVLPTAKLHCACGNRLAPSKSAAVRMGLPMMARNVRTCGCGAQVIDEVAAAQTAAIDNALRQALEVGTATCSCCNAKPSSLRIEVARGDWQNWCLDCVEERDAVIAERFGPFMEKSP